MSMSAKSKGEAAHAASSELRKVIFNLPNQLTWARLLLSAVMFAMIAYQQYWIAMWMFIVAASTDWLDGYFARKYNQVTTLGRILDPFADKVIICGTFIYLAAVPEFSGAAAGHFGYLRPWMAVVVIGRELLVTALRSFLEQQGADFSASLSGKLKMVLQCLAAGLSLYALSLLLQDKQRIAPWLHFALLASIWAAVLVTIYSGVGYIVSAIRLLRK
jgi:CDP-diacylglycerol--glycerol-3-phosphate 3-phosphatidyltransferase